MWLLHKIFFSFFILFLTRNYVHHTKSKEDSEKDMIYYFQSLLHSNFYRGLLNLNEHIPLVHEDMKPFKFNICDYAGSF